MIIELLTSVLAVGGTYEFVYDVLPSIPVWLTLPLLLGLSSAAWFAPFWIVCIVAVASAAGFIHGLVRRNTATSVVVPSRRTNRGYPPLP